MRTEKGMEKAKAARAAYNRENYKTVGVNLRKEDAEMFRQLATARGMTVGEALRRMITSSLDAEKFAPSLASEVLARPTTARLTEQNLFRLKHETSFHRTGKNPDEVLNEILDDYFAVADKIRGEHNHRDK